MNLLYVYIYSWKLRSNAYIICFSFIILIDGRGFCIFPKHYKQLSGNIYLYCKTKFTTRLTQRHGQLRKSFKCLLAHLICIRVKPNNVIVLNFLLFTPSPFTFIYILHIYMHICSYACMKMGISRCSLAYLLHICVCR